MTEPILNTHNKEEYAPAHTAEHLQSMTYEEYLAQQQQAIDVTVSPMKRGNPSGKGKPS